MSALWTILSLFGAAIGLLMAWLAFEFVGFLLELRREQDAADRDAAEEPSCTCTKAGSASSEQP